MGSTGYVYAVELPLQTTTTPPIATSRIGRWGRVPTEHDGGGEHDDVASSAGWTGVQVQVTRA